MNRSAVLQDPSIDTAVGWGPVPARDCPRAVAGSPPRRADGLGLTAPAVRRPPAKRVLTCRPLEHSCTRASAVVISNVAVVLVAATLEGTEASCHGPCWIQTGGRPDGKDREDGGRAVVHVHDQTLRDLRMCGTADAMDGQMGGRADKRMDRRAEGRMGGQTHGADRAGR